MTKSLLGSLASTFTVLGLLFPWTGKPLPPPPTLAPKPTPINSIKLGDCTPWEQVNINAFGISSNSNDSNPPYASEEAFEVAAFHGKLYLGMEGDNSVGARLWRSTNPLPLPGDWEEVAADEAGQPFGVESVSQADHIDSLAVFQGQLYASLANRSGNSTGVLLFRSPTGNAGSWENALGTRGPGFGIPANENFKDMQVFQNNLCGGTWNETSGAQVWCSSDGENWYLSNFPGFGNQDNIIIWSGGVFNDYLYFGVQNRGENIFMAKDDEGKIFRTHDIHNPLAWEEVYSGYPGSIQSDILGVSGDYIYISTSSASGIQIWRSSSGAGWSWKLVNVAGMNRDRANWGTITDGAAIYNFGLYVAVSNMKTGVQIWRTANNSAPLVWELINTPGFGDPANHHAQLISFRGHLYAWATNYHQGQGVWRTRCTTLPSQEFIPQQ